MSLTSLIFSIPFRPSAALTTVLTISGFFTLTIYAFGKGFFFSKPCTKDLLSDPNCFFTFSSASALS
jgi:hypothetical protein